MGAVVGIEIPLAVRGRRLPHEGIWQEAVNVLTHQWAGALDPCHRWAATTHRIQHAAERSAAQFGGTAVRWSWRYERQLAEPDGCWRATCLARHQRPRYDAAVTPLPMVAATAVAVVQFQRECRSGTAVQ